MLPSNNIVYEYQKYVQKFSILLHIITQKKWNFLQDVTSVEISKMHQLNTGLKVHSRILFCKWLGHDMISIETFLRNYLIMYELQGDKAS